MIAYFLMMGLLMIPAILLPQRRPHPLAWGFAFLLLLVFVGLRHKVGMDWNNYLLMVRNASYGTLWEAFDESEPSYAAILWASGKLGFGIYGANVISSLILLAGVFRFSKTMTLPWVSLLAAFPVLVVVVGMSANRQAAAIGVLLWLAAGWPSSSLWKRIGLTIFAATFHLSAIFFLVFAALELKTRLATKAAVVIVMSILALGYLQITGGAGYYDQAYVSGQSEMTFSSGATQHVLINGIPALILLVWRRLRGLLAPSSLLISLSWLAAVLVPLAFVFSVAAGRMTLYLFPVSMYFFSALPGVMGHREGKAIIRTLVSGLLFAILWIWLQYANSSFAHVPYSNVLMMHSWELHL